MKDQFISIVVPTRNEESNLPRLLRSISRLDYPKKKFELIVVDGYSTDKTVEIAKKFKAKVFQNPGMIRSTGCQIGIDKAKGKVIAFTDADCVVPPGWLKGLMLALGDNKKIASAGGPNVTPEDDTPFAKAAGDVLSLLTMAGSRYGFNSRHVVEIYHNPGCNVIYRKEAIQKVGGFNKKLLTCEDEELDFRLRQAGYKLLFTPVVSVDHYRRPTYKKIYIQAFRFAVGRVQAVKMHWWMIRWFHVLPSLFLLTLLAAIYLLIFSPLKLFFSLYLIFVFLFFVSLSVFTSQTKRNASPIAYQVILSCWILGWGNGFIKGILGLSHQD